MGFSGAAALSTEGTDAGVCTALLSNFGGESCCSEIGGVGLGAGLRNKSSMILSLSKIARLAVSKLIAISMPVHCGRYKEAARGWITFRIYAFSS